MSQDEQISAVDSETSALYDEPDFDAEVDEEDEANRIEAVHGRNRRRILIPLVLLIALFILLSLMGAPKQPAADQTPPVPASTTP